MTSNKSSWPTVSQLFNGMLLAGAHFISGVAGGGGRALTFGSHNAGPYGATPYNPAHDAYLTSALKLTDRDPLDSGRFGRTLTQSTSTVGTPGVTPKALPAPTTVSPTTPGVVASPVPPAPTERTPIRVLVPDASNYGAFNGSVNTTVARVQYAINDQGTDVILLDLFADSRDQSVDRNQTRLSEAVQVVNLATSLGAQVVVGPAKDDVTMYTPGRPEMNRVPTNETAKVLVALAQALKNNTQVALMAGGQPANQNGSLTQEIADRYASIFNQVRATGFNNNVYFKAPAHYGQNLSYYANGNTSYYNAQDIGFIVDLTSDGNATTTNRTLDQCLSLKCLVTVGVQWSEELGVFSSLDRVGFELQQAAIRRITTVLTPFADRVIQSDEGERVMLDGDVRTNASAPVALSKIGQQMVDLQRQAIVNASRAG